MKFHFGTKNLPVKNPAAMSSNRFGKRPPVFQWNDKHYKFLLRPPLLRWMNLLLGAFAIGFIYKGAYRFTAGNTSVAIAAATIAGLTPQFLHLTSTITNGASAYLAGAYLF